MLCTYNKNNNPIWVQSKAADAWVKVANVKATDVNLVGQLSILRYFELSRYLCIYFGPNNCPFRPTWAASSNMAILDHCLPIQQMETNRRTKKKSIFLMESVLFVTSDIKRLVTICNVSQDFENYHNDITRLAILFIFNHCSTFCG